MFVSICVYVGIGIVDIKTSGIRMTKSSHNVEYLRKMCLRILVLIHINKKKLLLARGNWIKYNRLPICIILSTLNNDMSITTLLILTSLQLSMISRLTFIIICV